MKITALAGATLTASILAGCISTQEMPLAPNVRLDTQSAGFLFTGQTVPQTMRKAATATLERGYTHFKISDAAMNQGSQVAGVVGNSTTNFNGSYGYGSMSGNSNSFGTASVVRAPTASAAATIVMFRANEPGAHGAFEAEQVLKQYSQ
jgi:hypothetical protein